MRRFRFPLAVLATSFGLVALLGLAAFLIVPRALAFGAMGMMGGPMGGPWGHGRALEAFPELQGLHDLSPQQRFGHFVGGQIGLKDKDGKPLTIAVTPGKATSVSSTSLSVAANDGTSKTFTLNDRTILRGQPGEGSPPKLEAGDSVVVVSDSSNVARVVMDGNTDGFGPPPPYRPFGGR